jgi:hypothetical protein
LPWVAPTVIDIKPLWGLPDQFKSKNQIILISYLLSIIYKQIFQVNVSSVLTILRIRCDFRLVEQYSELVIQYSGLAKPYSGLEIQYSGLEIQYSGLAKPYSGLGRQISVLRRHIQDLQRHIQDLRSNISDCGERIPGMKR